MYRYGWFEFRSNPLRITNSLTGQALSIRSRTAARGLLTGEIFDAVYEDSELSEEVTFNVGTNSRGANVILMDYGDFFEDPPDFHRWRRLDDFLTDALLCWPYHLVNRLAFRLEIIGCWRSGQWTSSLVRQFDSRKGADPNETDKYVMADAYVTPVTAPVSQEWELFDVENPSTFAKLEVDYIEDGSIPFLDKGIELKGFQGIVPYLRSKDGNAHIIFTQLQSSTHRGEDPETDLYYTYIDEDIFFTFISTRSKNKQLHSVRDYGYRYRAPGRDLWTRGIYGDAIRFDSPRRLKQNNWENISYPVWLRVKHALGDAWPAWGERKKLFVDNADQVDEAYGKYGYIGDYGPTVTGGFNAGFRNNWYCLRYLDPEDPVQRVGIVSMASQHKNNYEQ